jgi:hypothetical protein
MEFIWANADDGTILFVQFDNLERVSSTEDIIIVKFVPREVLVMLV